MAYEPHDGGLLPTAGQTDTLQPILRSILQRQKDCLYTFTSVTLGIRTRLHRLPRPVTCLQAGPHRGTHPQTTSSRATSDLTNPLRWRWWLFSNQPPRVSTLTLRPHPTRSGRTDRRGSSSASRGPSLRGGNRRVREVTFPGSGRGDPPVSEPQLEGRRDSTGPDPRGTDPPQRLRVRDRRCHPGHWGERRTRLGPHDIVPVTPGVAPVQEGVVEGGLRRGVLSMTAHAD